MDHREWIQALPPDAIAQVVNAYRDAFARAFTDSHAHGFDAQHRAGCAAARDALLSVVGSVLGGAAGTRPESQAFDGKYPVWSAEEMLLRKLLWLRHHDTTVGLYGDDGELQCSRCMIDFLRQSPREIERRFFEIGLAKLAAEQRGDALPAPTEPSALQRVLDYFWDLNASEYEAKYGAADVETQFKDLEKVVRGAVRDTDSLRPPEPEKITEWRRLSEALRSHGYHRNLSGAERRDLRNKAADAIDALLELTALRGADSVAAPEETKK